MRFRAVALGVVAGLILGGAIVILCGPALRPAVPLGEDRGRITRVVMQYQPDAGPLVAPIYAQLLPHLGADTEIIWAVAKAADLDDLRARLGAAWPAGHCRSMITEKPITTWAKDRFIAMTTSGGRAMLCAPKRTRSVNAARTNDQEVPFLLAQRLPKTFHTTGTEIDFDGGDVLATARHCFASPLIIEKNPPGATSRFPTREALEHALELKLGSPVTWLGDTPEQTPPHHIGMYLTVLGDMATVGDVRLAERVIAAHPDVRAAARVAGGIASPDFRAGLTAKLDRIARQMTSLGYTVVRVPLLPSATPRAWMSYNNGIVESHNGRTIFYMPTFGAGALDTAAAESFRSQAHCTVIPIDCAHVWQFCGSLHCLVNVVGRAEG